MKQSSYHLDCLNYLHVSPRLISALAFGFLSCHPTGVFSHSNQSHLSKRYLIYQVILPKNIRNFPSGLEETQTLCVNFISGKICPSLLTSLLQPASFTIIHPHLPLRYSSQKLSLFLPWNFALAVPSGFPLHVLDLLLISSLLEDKLDHPT